MAKELQKAKIEIINHKLNDLPWYVGEFIRDKLVNNYSASSLLGYTYDYLIFFEWIIREGFHKEDKKTIPLEVLDKLRTNDIQNFQYYLKIDLENNPVTIHRKIAALKELFYYLSNIAENDDLSPYLVRNVMAKIEMKRIKGDTKAKAKDIENKILRVDSDTGNNQITAFIDFVDKDYKKKIENNKKALHRFAENHERDVAIVSLFLCSGLRVSELVGLNLSDIDFTDNEVTVTRKGGKRAVVPFAGRSKADLKRYLAVRETRYNPPESLKAVFVTSGAARNQGKPNRMTVRAIQKMVDRYATAFGKPELSVHKLRHSYATHFQQKNGDIYLLQQILGHEDPKTTEIYTHLSKQDITRGVANLDL